MNIGEAAAASGVSEKMIRHYESIGLIARPARSPAGYRSFDARNVHELRFVHRARSLGFSLEEIRRLLKLWRDERRSSADVRRIAQRHADELGDRIDAMRAMQRALLDLVACCRAKDSMGARPDCPILDDLAAIDAPKKSARKRTVSKR
ncbi:MerR family DNA-binding protein [Roseiterribacter gracilis]|uniref:Cu(I)-responsive transcriptional regulator n=1 Tax=Roseiterribacter gracilis TaxID=2812848 RepID=A0A8S8XC46_9PROT|nr:Cu(I)-responsive transcriptional regulator [Rhodospirillales bacterium TMPK1]